MNERLSGGEEGQQWSSSRLRTEGLRVSVRDGRVRGVLCVLVRVERSARACATRDQVKWLM